MIIYVYVNHYLRDASYLTSMKIKPVAPGSKKGQAKPIKRRLDQGFSERLIMAMSAAGLDVPLLAKRVGCTRAVLGKYKTPGQSKTIEAHLLFEIADALGISVYWLLKNEGNMGKVVSLSPDQLLLLNLYSIMDEPSRSEWIEKGTELQRKRPSLRPSAESPFINDRQRIAKLCLRKNYQGTDSLAK